MLRRVAKPKGLTKKLPGLIVLHIRRADDNCGTSTGRRVSKQLSMSKGANHEHAPYTQNAHNRQLRPAIHLQIPYEKHRQQADGEVCERRARTIHVCDVDKDVNVQTRPGLGMSVPKKVDGAALENGEEEEEQSDYDGQRHGAVEDDDMDAKDGDPEEGDDDGYLRDNAGYHV